MSRIIVRAEGLSRVNVLDLMDAYRNVTFEFDDKNLLVIEYSKGEYLNLGKLEYIQVMYCEIDNGYLTEDQMKKGEVGYAVHQTQYFPINDLNAAIESFFTRLTSPTPGKESGKSYSLEDIKIGSEKKLMFVSHYDYLNCMLNDFWMKIFCKTSDDAWCAGIVSAHGDKCYQYRDEWKKAGIEFHHGALIFLLTYTSEFGETSKSKSDEWVINNYAKYKPIIDCCEKKILKEKYNVS